MTILTPQTYMMTQPSKTKIYYDLVMEVLKRKASQTLPKGHTILDHRTGAGTGVAEPQKP